MTQQPPRSGGLRGVGGLPAMVGRRQRLLLWTGGVALVAIMVASTGLILATIVSRDRESVPSTGEGRRALATRPLAIRSAPDSLTAIVGHLEPGDEVVLRGRTGAGDWLLVYAAGDPTTDGWVPADAVDHGFSPDQIVVVVAPPVRRPVTDAGSVPAVPTFTPDLADLTIDTVLARGNRLAVIVVNRGEADFVGTILVSVDGQEPIPADGQLGERLRPDERLEIVLESEYVQRRASVRVEVSTSPPAAGEPTENNTVEAIVRPDQPNDLAIQTISHDGPNGALRITVRNNSPIPITGIVTLSARERSGARAELGTVRPLVALDPGETLEVDFPLGARVNLVNIEALMNSLAIDDADTSNNVFPRR